MHNFRAKIAIIFIFISLNLYVLGVQKNRLNETVLLNTHNICFGLEINNKKKMIPPLTRSPEMYEY